MEQTFAGNEQTMCSRDIYVHLINALTIGCSCIETNALQIACEMTIQIV